MSTIPLLFSKYSGILNFSQSIAVPLGISFYSFEAISLLCDIHNNKIKHKTTLLDVFLYLSFFVTVTSGPIIRFNDFKNDLSKNLDKLEIVSASERIILGLFKKLLIANRIAILADYYFNGIASGGSYSALGLWLGSFAYSLQLYFDFSGYSDIAIGIGQLMGFQICENFNHPYCATSITDFWRRWHMSLSSWFRDYVYIPLGGNRCSIPRHIFNLFVVWLLTGLWHGADSSFVVWGLGYFILLTAEKYLPFINELTESRAKHIYTLFFVNMLWIPFRAADLNTAKNYIAGMFRLSKTLVLEEKAILFIPYLLFAIIMCLPMKKLLENYQEKKWYMVMKQVVIFTAFILSLCALINASYTPYIYGNF